MTRRIGGRWTPILALIVFCLTLLPALREAEALSCGFEQILHPKRQAVGVPLDVVPAALGAWVGANESHSDLSLENLDLEEPVPFDVEILELAGGMSSTLRLVRPRALLSPHTRYVFRVRSGEVQFTTGSEVTGEGESPNAFAGLRGLAAETASMQHYSSNDLSVKVMDGRINRVGLDYEPASGAVFYLFEFGKEGVAEPEFRYPLSPGDHTVGYHLCSPLAPSLEPGNRYCGTLTAYDAAGTPSGEAVQVCNDTDVCSVSYAVRYTGNYPRHSDWHCSSFGGCSTAGPVGTAARGVMGGTGLWVAALLLLLSLSILRGNTRPRRGRGSRSALLIPALLCLLWGSGCMSTSAYHGARPVEAGKTEMGIALEVGTHFDEEYDNGPASLVLSHPRVLARRGLSEKADFGLSAGASGMAVDYNRLLIDSKFAAISVNPTIGLAYFGPTFTPTDADSVWSALMGVLLEVGSADSVSLVLGVRPGVASISERPVHGERVWHGFVASSVAVQFPLKNLNMVVIPELSVLKVQNEDSLLWTGGIGLRF